MISCFSSEFASILQGILDDFQISRENDDDANNIDGKNPIANNYDYKGEAVEQNKCGEVHYV